VVEHVHGGCKQHTLVGRQARQAMIFAKKVFLTRGSRSAHGGAFLEKAEIQKAEDATFALQASLVMVEVEAVDGVLACRRESRKRRSIEWV